MRRPANTGTACIQRADRSVDCPYGCADLDAHSFADAITNAYGYASPHHDTYHDAYAHARAHGAT